MEEVVGNDYGPEEEYASLSGQCFEYTDQEYTYKFCAFDYCSQRPNSQGKGIENLCTANFLCSLMIYTGKIVFACQFNSYTYSAGGSETRLGKWEKWEDELYNVQLYEHGVQCWNGPQRSTRVVMRCGLRNALVASTEPNRCEYKFVFETPALCKAQDIMTDESMGDGHDEL